MQNTLNVIKTYVEVPREFRGSTEGVPREYRGSYEGVPREFRGSTEGSKFFTICYRKVANT